ncbi:uncharacterized protein [Taeniopygia guttata]|uniref:uncharacterized protein n=1 Tax=Taeniopygia guttata TaxID=59729 RepID=UPI003BB8AB87
MRPAGRPASPTGSRRGPAAGSARGPHRCLAASPATTEPVRDTDRDRPRRRRPPPAPSDQEMGRHRKSRCRREHRPRASASCRARRRRPGLSRAVPPCPGMSRPTASRPAALGAPRAPRCGGRGSGGSAGWRRRARHAGGGSSPCQAEGGPGGSGDYKSRHAARRDREGAVAERPGRGRPSDRSVPGAATGTADGARRLCVLLAARDECRNPVREEPRPTLGLCTVTETKTKLKVEQTLHKGLLERQSFVT